MKKQQYISYFLILIGSITAIYGQSGAEKNVTLLIIGIVILMYGIYRISSKIPSKFDKEPNDIENEHEDI
ncbi:MULTISPECIES: hypothetical protein [Bizionia]|uniref:Uncharacterized protein n=1 Tax=Bizionia algoritergicola TaxID=291187 RepID=A0A5D0QSR8_9FLAO|nr:MULTISPECIES: hypothetical protein [Bizionia]OBX21093.1 hypothetical protein BAA08_13985 [Bizionia sp. APA-3]TYB72263.1 hypothetical protein ES675_10870 [Bizionia algoritergicola]